MKKKVAKVVILNEYGQVFLARTKKHPDYWQPVGGAMEPEDGSLLDAALREVEEECMLHLKPEDLSFEFVADGQLGEFEIFFFTAHVKPTDIITPNDELAEWGWFSIEDTAELNILDGTRRVLQCLLERRL